MYSVTTNTQTGSTSDNDGIMSLVASDSVIIDALSQAIVFAIVSEHHKIREFDKLKLHGRSNRL